MEGVPEQTCQRSSKLLESSTCGADSTEIHDLGLLAKFLHQISSASIAFREFTVVAYSRTNHPPMVIEWRRQLQALCQNLSSKVLISDSANR